jgi:cytochrome c-type biogenesis protein CcmH
MSAFAAAATAMAIAAALVVLLAPRWSQPTRSTRRMLNVAVLRQQLAELDRDLAAGLLSPAEHADARALLMRRLVDDTAADTAADLAVDRAARVANDRARDAAHGSAQHAPFDRAPRAPAAERDASTAWLRRPQALIALAAALLPPAALALYAIFGSPQSIARPADAPATVDALQSHVRRHADDARAWVMLARAQLVDERWAEAAHSFARATAASEKVARDPQIWCDWADVAGMAQGSLLGEPQRLIAHALQLDALQPCALELAGSAAIEARDFRAARDHWQRLLARLPEGSTQHTQLAQALQRVERQARFALPR